MRRNPTIKIYPVSRPVCTDLATVCTYKQGVQRGGERERETENVGSCRRGFADHSCVFVTDLGRITAKIAIRKIRLYRGSVSIYRTPLPSYTYTCVPRKERSTPFSEQWTLVPFSFYIFALSDHSPLVARITHSDGRF